MMWYQNSFLLDPTDRRAMFSKGDKYMLNITNFQPSDFGNYRWVEPGVEIDYKPFRILFSSDSFGSRIYPVGINLLCSRWRNKQWIYVLLNDLIIGCRKVNLTNLINWPELLSIPSINWGEKKAQMQTAINHVNFSSFFMFTRFSVALLTIRWGEQKNTLKCRDVRDQPNFYPRHTVDIWIDTISRLKLNRSRCSRK